MNKPTTANTAAAKAAAASAAVEPTSEPAQPPAAKPAEDPLAAARAEIAASQDRYLRAVADLENFRRRTVREKEELRLYAASRVLESFDRVAAAGHGGIDGVRIPAVVSGRR